MGNGLEIIANVPHSQLKRKCINIAFNREPKREGDGERDREREKITENVSSGRRPVEVHEKW